MTQTKPGDEWVRRVMPDASDAEVEEAAWRWFKFVQLLDRIILRLEQEERDSHESHLDDRFKTTTPKL